MFITEAYININKNYKLANQELFQFIYFDVISLLFNQSADFSFKLPFKAHSVYCCLNRYFKETTLRQAT